MKIKSRWIQGRIFRSEPGFRDRNWIRCAKDSPGVDPKLVRLAALRLWLTAALPLRACQR